MNMFNMRTILCIIVFVAVPQAWAAANESHDMASYFRANGFTAWKCDTCGLVNSEQQLICQACFDMRPTPIEMFKSHKLETLVHGFYRQIDDKNPLEAGIVRKTISNIHGECGFCRKPLSLSDIDLSPFDCDHSFHQTCLLKYGDSRTLFELFQKFATDGGKCPVESCRIDFSKGKIHKFTKRVSYQGEWQYNWRNLHWKMHGKGIYTIPSICVYKGDFKDNKFDGVGIITRSSGSCYTGEWKDDRENGSGKEIIMNVDIYDGEFVGGKRHGRGISTTLDGVKYDGEFKDGTYHGNGILIVRGEYKYEGEFKDHKFHGNGKVIYSNDHIYDGEWLDGEKHGKGILTIPNEYKYEGEFKYDKQNGTGKAVYLNGD
eukprot:628968_1